MTEHHNTLKLTPPLLHVTSPKVFICTQEVLLWNKKSPSAFGPTRLCSNCAQQEQHLRTRTPPPTLAWKETLRHELCSVITGQQRELFQALEEGNPSQGPGCSSARIQPLPLSLPLLVLLLAGVFCPRPLGGWLRVWEFSSRWLPTGWAYFVCCGTALCLVRGQR